MEKSDLLLSRNRNKHLLVVLFAIILPLALYIPGIYVYRWFLNGQYMPIFASVNERFS